MIGTVGISLPVTVIGAKFSKAFDKRQQSDVMRDLHPRTSSVTNTITNEAQRLDDFHLDLMAFRELVKRKYPDLMVPAESLDVVIDRQALVKLIQSVGEAPVGPVHGDPLGVDVKKKPQTKMAFLCFASILAGGFFGLFFVVVSCLVLPAFGRCVCANAIP